MPGKPRKPGKPKLPKVPKQTVPQPPRVQYWDACLFIELLTGKDQSRVAEILKLVAGAKSGRITIVLSTFILAEVRPSSPRVKYIEDYKPIISELLETDRPFVQWFALPRSIANRAADLGVKFPNLTVPDCIHLATAVVGKATQFFTYDGVRPSQRRRSKDLIQYNGLIGEPPMEISVPYWSEGPLFDRYAMLANQPPPKKK